MARIRTSQDAQRGVALITALVFLVILTLLGLSSVRLITQQERGAQYTYDRGLAFQAAESALRQAEDAIETTKPTPAAGSCAPQGSGTATVQICPPPDASATPRWKNADFDGWANAAATGTSTLVIQPQYFAEYLGNTFPCDYTDPGSTATCKRYRITARAGGSGRAEAMVQSIYATD